MWWSTCQENDQLLIVQSCCSRSHLTYSRIERFSTSRGGMERVREVTKIYEADQHFPTCFPGCAGMALLRQEMGNVGVPLRSLAIELTVHHHLNARSILARRVLVFQTNTTSFIVVKQ